MSVVINTNSAATMAANNLANSTSLLQKSLNRLSSGSRIGSPEDDAGGLAVAMKLSATSRRQQAVASNIASSNSFLQTQDGVLGVVGKTLSRISELRTMYMDPTKNSSDLGNYNAEFVQLQTELSSLANESFIGIALFGSAGLNVAVTESGNSNVSFGAAALLAVPSSFTDNFADFSNWTNTSTGTGTATVSGGVLTLANNLSGQSAITSLASMSGPTTISYTQTGSIEAMVGGVPLDHVSVGGAATDIKWVLDGTGNGDIYFNNSYVASYSGLATSGAIQLLGYGGAGGGGTVNNFAVTSGGGGGGGSGKTSSIVHAANLGTVNLATITDALQDVSTFRANNGAQQSRLDFAAEVLTTNQANIEAANSRIMDVDVAAESTQLARYNVLTQAGTAMLSQANQSSQVALKLLG